MKKLLLTGLAFASILTLNALALAQLVAQDDKFYTTDHGYRGDLSSLVKGGTTPYKYYGQSPKNGVVMVDPNGSFYFSLGSPYDSGSFEFHVIDANGTASNDATIEIEKGSTKSKLE